MDRSKFIGGTDAAAILGLSKWRTPFQVWLEKTGQAEPQVENSSMEWGKRLEDAVARKWADEHNVAILEPGVFLRHKKHKFLGGSPDRLAVCPRGGLEVKTARYGAPWGDMPDEIPADYWLQCQWYTGLHRDLDCWNLAVLIGGVEYKDYVIPFDRETYELAVEVCAKFWVDHVQTRVPPPIDGSEAAGGWLRKKFPAAGNALGIATQTQGELIAARIKLKEQIKEQEKLLAIMDNQLKEAIGERKGLVCDDGKVTWVRANGGTQTDWKAVAEELSPSEELIKKFSKQKAGSNYLKFS